MDESTDLLTAFRHLEPTSDESSLASVLDALTVALTGAVASYHGLELTLHSHGHPLVLNSSALPPDGRPGAAGESAAAATSLRLPLDLLDAGFEPGSQVVVYAAASGALVDLAADLEYALNPTADSSLVGSPTGTRALGAAPDAGTPPHVVLDADLPPQTSRPGLRGLPELSSIAQAEGVMIERGHHPDEVSDTLRRQAAAAGLAPHAFAVGVLQGLPHLGADQLARRQACSV